MRSIKFLTGCALMLALFIITAAVVYAASGAVNEIQGTVKDALGRPLSGAGLILKSPDETVRGKTKSDAEGHFVFSNVKPGAYAVLADKSGFQTGSAIVTLEAGTIATATLTLAAAFALASTQKAAGNTLKVIAVETFLADIAQNIAGDRVQIRALLPVGADPHTFQPTPADVRGIAESNVLIINGAGFEEYLDELLKNLGGTRKVIDASAGLSFRAPGEDESAESDEKDPHHEAAHHDEGDPHFWFSPANVVRYVENICNGLSEADSGGAEIYAANAGKYTAKLSELDQWMSDQVKQIPANGRLLVTDHDEFGYFADRYGFKIIGMVIPSFSSEASPSAMQITQLVKKIRQTGAKAIFLEAGEAPQLAEQIAREAAIKVVTGLYTHSISQPDGPASNYIEMMRHNTLTIVNALK